MFLKKQLEYVAVLVLICLVSFLPIIIPITFMYLLYAGSIGRYLVISYLVYLYFDWDTRDQGGRRSHRIRNSIFLKLVRSYFKMTFVTTADIPPNHNYIVGLHPHGLLTLHAFAVVDSSEKFKKAFGNAVVSFCTASYNTIIPITRDLFFSLGSINASEKSLVHCLSNPNGGNIAQIAIGGAKEASILSRRHEVVLKNRKGFCKVALKTGAHLIPSYAFGENELWNTVEIKKTGLFYNVQQYVLKMIGIGVPIVKGEGKYHYMFVMPRRRTITHVHGVPIPVTKSENPQKEEVEALHEKYIQGLKNLFDSQKHNYLEDKNAELFIS